MIRLAHNIDPKSFPGRPRLKEALDRLTSGAWEEMSTANIGHAVDGAAKVLDWTDRPRKHPNWSAQAAKRPDFERCAAAIADVLALRWLSEGR
ncbi:MAG: hypothetical protein EOP84_27765, partial [Verrucomicrobiaceae bacterium]